MQIDFPMFSACPDCDLLIKCEQKVQEEQKEPNYALYCPRCGRLLQKKNAHCIEKSLALSLAGLFLFFPALFLPLLNFEVFGFSDSGTLLHSILHLFSSKFYFVASMVALFAAIFPLAILCLSFTVALLLHCRISSRWTALLFRSYLHINEWAMMDVYLLGILVAIIKMLTTANIEYLTGFFCFIATAIIITTLSSIIDKAYFWQKIEELQPLTKKDAILTPLSQQLEGEQSAISQQLLSCHDCGKLLSRQHEGEKCPRCSAQLHLRKNGSRERSWALVCAAAMLLLPANAIPIMGVDFFGTANLSTIIDGIIYFFKDGAWFVGTVIFIASILVPFFKVIGLYLLLCGKNRSRKSLQRRTKLYRFIAVTGRWSMLDIFVIALLASSINFDFVSSTWIAEGARWFCLVVVITMLAVINFDPRLMWDGWDKRENLQQNLECNS